MATQQEPAVSSAASQTGITLPVTVKQSPDVPIQYANYVSVQIAEYDCYLAFCVAAPPILTGTAEENQRVLENMKAIEANIVAKIMVPRDLVPKLVAVFQSVGLDKPIALQTLLANPDYAKALGGNSGLVIK